MAGSLAQRVIGQPQAAEAIVPFVQMYESGLSPEGRPAGVFLLLGPTGTGKTRTVEALAEVIHGSARHVLRVDCGEFQLDHEVAKLIGAPPGYLGHRETHPVLTQARLASVTSERSALSIVLFDEIEKAAPSMTRLMLGMLDKGTLRLGDNNVVNFERTLIFMTSNVGADRMMRAMEPSFGFSKHVETAADDLNRKMEKTALAAARRTFSPEFMNRIDSVIAYRPLSEESLGTILEQQLFMLQMHIDHRLGVNTFTLQMTRECRGFLLKDGTSTAFGAREIKRAIHRHVTTHLAAMLSEGGVRPGGVVRVELNGRGDGLRLRTIAAA